MRVVCVAMMAVLSGCGDEAVTGGGESGTNIKCPIPLPQEGDDAGGADGGTDVTVAPDVAGGPGPLGAGEALLVGEWRDCGGVWSLNKDGSWIWRGAYMDCDVKGTAAFADGHLDVVVTEDTCFGAKDWMTTGLAVSFNGSTMALVSDAIRLRVKLLTHGALARKVWDVSAGGTLTQLALCYLPSGAFFDGGYRTLDGSCQPLSCGGGVNGLKPFPKEDGGVDTHIWLSCSGWCPCSSLIIVTEETPTTLAGTYAGGNCQGATEGAFTAVPGSYPDGF